ncbi:MAG: hypothetical protein QNJ97_18475 [Myxococcota bacterium]|nr:hypothetical protein [Myxococcota bacterium]
MFNQLRSLDSRSLMVITFFTGLSLAKLSIAQEEASTTDQEPPTTPTKDTEATPPEAPPTTINAPEPVSQEPVTTGPATTPSTPTDQVPAPAVSPEPPSQPVEKIVQQKTGFVLEPHFGIRAGLGLEYEYSYWPSSLEGGVMLGRKEDRVIWGISFDLRRIALIRKFESDFDEGSAARDTDRMSYTIFLIAPGFRVAVFRSNDEKLDLTLQLDLGFGAHVMRNSSDRDDVDRSFNFTYAVGPGLRYWIHPQFAIGAVGLLSGDVQGIEDDRKIHLMSISSVAQVTGVF